MSKDDGRKITRKQFLEVVGAGALLPVVGSGGAAGASRRTDASPNVILIISDDQAYNELGLLNRDLQTPNLDRLAGSGARFSNAFVNTSICAPARACILTGLYSRQNGVTDNMHMVKRSDSLLPYLEKAGYVTGFVGKWHFPLFPDVSQFGFTWKASVLPRAWLAGYPLLVHNPRGQGDQPIKLTKEEGDSMFTDAAISFLESHQDKRFFLWLAYVSPHAPLLMPGKFRKMYDPQSITLPVNLASKHGEKPLVANTPAAPEPVGSPVTDLKYIREFTAGYHGLVSYLDEQIGRITDALRRLRLSENTLIIFVGDNGFLLGNHGYGGKGYLYEESVRVPLIFNWPGRIKPRVVEELACQVDILPTVMEVAHVPAPSGLAGKSLFPLLEGKKAPWREEVFCELYPRGWKAVRTRRWKYIYTPELEDELYDLSADPYEERNLAGDPKYGAVLKTLKAKWSAWEKEAGRPKAAQEEAGRYVETIKKERQKLAKLITQLDYEPLLLVDIGKEGLLAWLSVLEAEGKSTDRLWALVDPLKKMPYRDLLTSPQAKALETEFLKELVRCESGT